MYECHFQPIKASEVIKRADSSDNRQNTYLKIRDFEKAITKRPEIPRFYRDNHKYQTVEHVLDMKRKYRRLDKAWMGVWDAIEIMDGLVDSSDPDVNTTQAVHALQTAEAAKRDGQPPWFILTALIHDLGKMLYFMGEPQWTVSGDTFPVGCRFADKLVYREFFVNNPDFYNESFSTECGIYSPQCGLKNVHLSFGHDEYLYLVCKDYLPKEALAIIRYHSFYAWHTDGEYSWLMDDHDTEMIKWVKLFSHYDRCFSVEGGGLSDINALKPFYLDLIAAFFPPKIRW